MEQHTFHRIGISSRSARFVLGMGLILSVFAGSGPIGWAALLPLAGIYPTLTAFLGVDPVYGFLRGGKGRGVPRSGTHRPAHA